jgi:threonine/homoserine efflux transporter RhtA
MSPKDLFVVGARLLGIWFLVSSFPAAFSLDIVGCATGVSGLILIVHANRIAQFFYPREFTKAKWLEKAPRDFRDS